MQGYAYAFYRISLFNIKLRRRAYTSHLFYAFRFEGIESYALTHLELCSLSPCSRRCLAAAASRTASARTHRHTVSGNDKRECDTATVFYLWLTAAPGILTPRRYSERITVPNEITPSSSCHPTRSTALYG